MVWRDVSRSSGGRWRRRGCNEEGADATAAVGGVGRPRYRIIPQIRVQCSTNASTGRLFSARSSAPLADRPGRLALDESGPAVGTWTSFAFACVGALRTWAATANPAPPQLRLLVPLRERPNGGWERLAIFKERRNKDDHWLASHCQMYLPTFEPDNFDEDKIDVGAGEALV